VEIWREKNEFSGKVCVLFSKRDTNKNVHEPETNETMSRPVFAVCAVLALISQVCTHAAYCSVCLSHLSLCTPCSLHDKRLRAHVVCIVSSKIFTILRIYTDARTCTCTRTRARFLTRRKIYASIAGNARKRLTLPFYMYVMGSGWWRHSVWLRNGTNAFDCGLHPCNYREQGIGV